MLLRLLILALLALLGYTLWTALRRSISGDSPDSAPRSSSSRRGEEMVQDPHCGTYVPRHEAIEERSRGGTQYFCSTACRDAYRKQK
ncbi:MAG: PP0621 family protein [Geoalkalibacter sp.]|jgi:YHS domain-containing protein|uniref:PP0621 family protein n=1 Tax=Geoalkalibacter sp. TaxID=3041440 RepID=UPI002A95014F|nr:PP0621 family protein [Thermodesulfobacteriota bacterium]